MLKPNGRRVLLKEKVVEDTTTSGIVVSTSGRKTPFYEVVAVSDTITVNVKVGDIVVLEKVNGAKVSDTDGTIYVIADERSINAIVEL